MKPKIGIIGGGVAGSTAALRLSGLGAEITLFEKAADISSGPPYCHLHAGGNLYREISDEQCLTLLRQSIDFVRAYPYTIDRRPTVIALPVDDPGTPEALLPRLKKLQKAYAELIESDFANAVLGEPEAHYRLYDRQTARALGRRKPVASPRTPDEWMIPALRELDLDALQYPLVLVQEYGINLFRYAAGVTLDLQAGEDVTLRLGTLVQSVEACGDQWHVAFSDSEGAHSDAFDYLINASGFRTGSVDDMVGVKAERMVEFKASYIAKHDTYRGTLFPEIIIHGQRGTPKGMAQFTPYPGGYYQLHGMSRSITLYDGGLVKSTDQSAQPQLEAHFIEKLDHAWKLSEIETRTKSAIAHVAQFIPAFCCAHTGSKPLFGAQQIPGDDPTLRVAEVAFPLPRYARCEIVKVSSALDMADAVLKQMVSEGVVENPDKKQFVPGHSRDEQRLAEAARSVAHARGYPVSMADLTVMGRNESDSHVTKLAV
jgi:glycine/D-amino acid oxidase-like deaminating enzyme